MVHPLGIAIDDNVLPAGYRAMAADTAREDEAVTWTEDLIGDTGGDDE